MLLLELGVWRGFWCLDATATCSPRRRHSIQVRRVSDLSSSCFHVYTIQKQWNTTTKKLLTRAYKAAKTYTPNPPHKIKMKRKTYPYNALQPNRNLVFFLAFVFYLQFGASKQCYSCVMYVCAIRCCSHCMFYGVLAMATWIMKTPKKKNNNISDK